MANKLKQLEAEVATLKAQLAEKTALVNRFLDEQETLDHIVRIINREVAFDRVLKSVLDQGVVLFPQAQSGVFFLYDEHAELFRVEAVYGYDFEQVSKVLLTKGEATGRYADWTYRIKEGIYLVKNPNPNRSGSPKVAHLPTPKAMLSMAIQQEGNTIGYIVFDNFTNVNAFDEISLATLIRFRNQAVTAFNKARFIQAIQTQAQDLEKLDKIVKIINAEHQLQKVLTVLVHQGVQLIPQAEKGVFLMFDASSQTFYPVAAYGYELAAINHVRFTWEEAMQRYAMSSQTLNQGVYMVSHVDRQRVGGEKLAALPIPRSMLAMTVELDGKITGFVVFDNFTRPAAFNVTDVQKLSRYRDHAISAIGRAHALQEADARTQELETLEKIIREINDEVEYDKVLSKVLEQGIKLVPQAEKAAFMMRDPEDNLFKIVVANGYTDVETSKIAISAEKAIERYALGREQLREGVFIIVPQQKPLPVLQGLAASVPVPMCMLAMTVEIEDQIEGFILFDNFTSATAFASSDLKKLTRFRNHAISAFARARYIRQIENQNILIAQKTKDITDSIVYARRIQEAILPPITRINQAFKDSFVLYLPKDIVSGDFYWFTEIGDYKIIALGDCTGHGVPGAFMSVMGNTLLNLIVNQRRITDPELILNELNKEVRQNLKQHDPSSRTNDGMEIALVTINTKGRVLTFAGANRPMYFYHKGCLEDVKGDGHPIGGGVSGSSQPFTRQTMPYHEGDCIYLTSDGYVDQFGGPRFKKFMTRNFRELLVRYQVLTMSEQGSELRKQIQTWMGHHEQTDDILVIGIKL